MVGVIKQFVDGGVTVWLRFAHEFNCLKIPSNYIVWAFPDLLFWLLGYYRRGSDDHDPTGRRSYHDPSPANFLTSWRLVYDTFKRELPTVQHMWCANVGGMDEIRQFWPGEEYVVSHNFMKRSALVRFYIPIAYVACHWFSLWYYSLVGYCRAWLLHRTWSPEKPVPLPRWIDQTNTRYVRTSVW